MRDKMSATAVFCILFCAIVISVFGDTPSEILEDDYIPFYDTGIKDEFDWKLLKALNNEHYKNVILSPVSVKIVMALLYEGAGGITEQEIQKVLNFNANKTLVRQEFYELLRSLNNNKMGGCSQLKYGENNKNYTLNFGTRIFIDNEMPVQQAFQTKACDKYQTAVETVNFSKNYEASDRINYWVAQLTLGKITKLVNPSDIESAIMVISNAIYFRGQWLYKFPKSNSHMGGFYLSPGEVAQVPYMSTTSHFYFVDSTELNAKLIRLPYQGSKYSMILALPNSKAGLAQFIRQLNFNTLRKNINVMDKALVDLVLPKFQFDFQIRLSGILQKLGLNSMFENTASLAGISRGSKVNLVLSDIIQKSGIEIDEDGSVAYSVTEIELHNKFGEVQATFNATYPFLFFIEDRRTRTLLFIGKVENPLDMNAVPLPSRFGGVDETYQEPVAAAMPAELQIPGFQLNPTYNEQDLAVAKRFNYFDLELLRELTTDDNIFISPASIKTTLAMILEGAYGSCAEEIAKTLRLPLNTDTRDQLKPLLYDLSDKSETSVVEAANGIFVSNKLTPVEKYVKTIESVYHGFVRPINYTDPVLAATAINYWVKNATKGYIPSIISAENIRSASSIVIANAMFFKGVWMESFEEKNNRVKCFVMPNGQCVMVDMMQKTAEVNYASIEEIDAHALELPYKDDKYAMLILLPRLKNNIFALTKDLQHQSFSNILKPLEKVKVNYEIPKFSIDYSTDMMHALKKLGIREIFGQNANLTGIIAKSQVLIDSIVHKTRIDVNEEGTVAAAATGALIVPLMSSSIPQVIADHPFAFFIYRKDNHNILFEGVINRPNESKNAARPQGQRHY